MALVTRKLEHALLRFVLLSLRNLQLVLCLGKIALRLVRLALGRGKLVLQRAALGGEFLEFVGAAEDADVAVQRAAGHRPAPVDDLSVQRNNAETVLILSRHGNAAIQIVHHDGIAQHAGKHRTIFLIVLHQLRGNAHKAVFGFQSLFLQHRSADRSERLEGRTPAVALFEEVDRRLGVLLTVNNDVLHLCAQRDLNGNGILLLRAHQIRR